MTIKLYRIFFIQIENPLLLVKNGDIKSFIILESIIAISQFLLIFISI